MGTTHTRRVLVVDALLGALLATVLGLCLVGAGRGARDARVVARFSIQRRGPPAASCS